MIEPPSNLTRLDYWTEIIGPYKGCYRIENLICFKIGNKTIAFDSNTTEAETLNSKLKKEYINQNIGVLRTDSLEIPLIIRQIKEQKEHVNI
jgi:hypothetical protein